MYYNDDDFRQLITTDACSRCTERKVACFVTMQIGSDRRSCCLCGDKFSVASKCSLHTAARRDIVYHVLLPSGEPSEDALVPRVAYSSREATIARQAYENGLISRIPDHVPTGPKVLLRYKGTGPTTAQATTATTQAVVKPSAAPGSTSAPDLTLRRCKLTKPALLQMLAGRALEEQQDPVPASAERDQAPGPQSTSPVPATIGLTQSSDSSDSSDSSESSSPSSSVIELEPTVPIAAPISSRVTIPSSDSATLDCDVSPEPSSPRPRVSSETVFHLIAINNSKDPRAHEASTLRFQERQMSVRVYSNQYDGPGFDYGPAPRISNLGRGPRVGSPSTSGGEGSNFAGTENEKLLKEIEDTEMENVHMNSQLRRERLKANAKAMREMKGDGGYEKALKWELQKKRREQQARNDEIDGELTKSKDLSIMMVANCQARPNPPPPRSENWDNEDMIGTTTTNDNIYETDDNDQHNDINDRRAVKG
jgi:hypothetical protein